LHSRSAVGADATIFALAGQIDAKIVAVDRDGTEKDKPNCLIVSDQA